MKHKKTNHTENTETMAPPAEPAPTSKKDDGVEDTFETLNPPEFYNFNCPGCGEENSLSLDISGGSHQMFSIDCGVCCIPIAVDLRLEGEEVTQFSAEAES